MKKHLIIIFLAIVGLSLGMNGFASEKKGPEMGKGHRINVVMSHEIIGSPVYNLKGERLGKVKDFALDYDTAIVGLYRPKTDTAGLSGSYLVHCRRWPGKTF